MADIKFRKTLRLNSRGAWTEVPFESLAIGDLFCLYEDGALIMEGCCESVPVPCEPEGNYSMRVTKYG